MGAQDQKTILVVEDEVIIAIATSETIKSFGFGAIIVNTGEKAVEAAFSNENISLIIMDIDLGGGIDGSEAARRILEKRSIPILFYTSHTEQEYIDRVKKIARYGYVIKSSGDFVLRSSIEMAFEMFEAHENLKLKMNELQQSEERYKTIIAVSNTGAWEYHFDTDYLWCSPEYFSMLGYDRTDFDLSVKSGIEAVWIDLLHPEDKQRSVDHFMHYLKKDSSAMYESYFRMKCKNGSWRWICSRGQTLRDQNGVLTGRILGTHTDITDRKQIEYDLRLRESYLLAIIENQPGLLWLKDLDGRFLSVNKEFVRIFGMNDPKLLAGKTDFDIFPRELASKYVEDDLNIIKSGKPYMADEQISDNGKIIWVETFKAPVIDRHGEIIGTTGYSHNITGRKLVEETLREKTALLEAQVNSSSDAILVIDNNQKRIVANQRVVEMFNVPQDVMSGDDDAALLNHVKNLNRYPDEFLKKVMYLYDHPGDISYDEIELKDGRFLQRYSAPVLGDDMKYYGRIWTFRDITLRKQSEEALIESKERHQTFINSTDDMAFLKDENFRYQIINKANADFFGKKPEDIIGLTDFDLMDPRSAGNCMATDKRAIQENKIIIDEERVGDRIFETRKFPVKMRNGNIGVGGYIREITERKRVEEELKRHQVLLTTIIDSTSEAIFAKDIDGKYHLINEAGARMLGHKVQEVIGSADEDLINAELAREFRKTDEYVVANNCVYEREEPGVINGKPCIFLAHKAPWHDNFGKVIGVIGVSSVITDRKQAEEKIKSLLAEKQLMLVEVHHRIKNNMNIIAGLMQMQTYTLKDPAAIMALKETRHRVNSMMLLYDKLYHSADFKEISFKEYISPLVDEIVGNFSSDKKVKVEKNIADFMIGAEKSSYVGIIINELLTNIMKYAFAGRSGGTINISVALLDNRVKIVVADDGVGISESISITNSAGFGFQLVDILTQQLRGAINIERDNGTRFILEFNLLDSKTF